jgi:hypothetical protein
MGLYVHSLGEIPAGTERAYYVYLLDYRWEGSSGQWDSGEPVTNG